MTRAARPIWFQRTGAVAIVLVYLSFTYAPHLGWWVSLLGTWMIVAMARITWPGPWIAWIGFRIPRRDILGSLVLFAASLAAAAFLQPAAARAAGVIYVPPWATDAFPGSYLHTAGQTVNEEIVLGALLLQAATRLGRRVRWITLSMLLAVVFAGLHFVFYAARPVTDVNFGVLTIPALIALFGVGVIRNNLILTRGHLAWAWAIHLGWNTVFFAGRFRWAGTATFLDEPERFNHLLGYEPTVAVILLGLVVTVVIGWRVLGTRGPLNA